MKYSQSISLATHFLLLNVQNIDAFSSSSSENMSPKKVNGMKRRTFVSDGVDVMQSFDPLEDPSKPEQVHTLILGTMPSEKSFGNGLSSKDILLRGGDGPQNYGHPRNSFWNIVGSSFGFCRHQLPYPQQVKTLIGRGYAVWDVLQEAKRKGSLDSNLVKGSLRPTDIPKFIVDHPNLTRFVFAANSAEIFCRKDVWASWLDLGAARTIIRTTAKTSNRVVKVQFWIQDEDSNPYTFRRTHQIFGRRRGVSIGPLSSSGDASDDDKEVTKRTIELIVMPSTSPANASSRPPEKEQVWHKAAYGLTEPPSTYVCPGCQSCATINDDVAKESRSFRTNKKRKGASTMAAPSFEVGASTMAAPSSEEYNKESGLEEGVERHWFQDCPYRENWRLAKLTANKKKQKGKTAKTTSMDFVSPDSIDPFDWYT